MVKVEQACLLIILIKAKETFPRIFPYFKDIFFQVTTQFVIFHAKENSCYEKSWKFQRKLWRKFIKFEEVKIDGKSEKSPEKEIQFFWQEKCLKENFKWAKWKQNSIKFITIESDKNAKFYGSQPFSLPLFPDRNAITMFMKFNQNLCQLWENGKIM